ncbi:unnamed protein product [Notodromas monacha]|uniref:Uncharacterized protein n=1 Tax=Notodromas monacha TaxID=399045 RepID=A0A7R9GG39_9CRUS|nr:unnamed protein product [Notodromas monacha]CAG0919571.1 unnamed protein product [Notodromas monacha]
MSGFVTLSLAHDTREIVRRFRRKPANKTGSVRDMTGPTTAVVSLVLVVNSYVLLTAAASHDNQAKVFLLLDLA